MGGVFPDLIVFAFLSLLITKSTNHYIVHFKTLFLQRFGPNVLKLMMIYCFFMKGRLSDIYEKINKKI